jgi:hypothetical protein
MNGDRERKQQLIHCGAFVRFIPGKLVLLTADRQGGAVPATASSGTHQGSSTRNHVCACFSD